MNLRHLFNRMRLRFRQQGILGVGSAALRLGARRTGLFPYLVRCRQIADTRRYQYTARPNPFKTIFVNPNDISHYLFPEYKDTYRWFGRVQPGNWDLSAQKIEDTKKFRGVVQRYKKGYEWNETDVFNHMHELVEDGKYPDSCRSSEDIQKRYDEIDKLYQSIKINGYKSEYNLPSDRGNISDICLAIGRNGEFYLQGDGIHRVAITRVLNISEVPVKVLMRHLRWQQTRDAIASKKRNPTHLINHPDLQDLIHSTISR